MLYGRTTLSRKPNELAHLELTTLREKDQLGASLVLKDPSILDLLGVRDHYQERDLEDAILREVELFLLEMGAAFCFIARQKRIQLDGEDFYIDLLLYNRKLKRLIAVELKQGVFRAELKGQMELDLRWLARYEREEGEALPLGIILCAGASAIQVELLELDAAGIHVAEYLRMSPRLRLHRACNRPTYWPTASANPMAERMNAATKHVATHRPESLTWGSAVGLGPDIVSSVRDLKAQPGPDLILAGSSTLTSSLLEHGLADELILLVDPSCSGAANASSPKERRPAPSPCKAPSRCPPASSSTPSTPPAPCKT